MGHSEINWKSGAKVKIMVSHWGDKKTIGPFLFICLGQSHPTQEKMHGIFMEQKNKPKCKIKKQAQVFSFFFFFSFFLFLSFLFSSLLSLVFFFHSGRLRHQPWRPWLRRWRRCRQSTASRQSLMIFSVTKFHQNTPSHSIFRQKSVFEVSFYEKKRHESD